MGRGRPIVILVAVLAAAPLPAAASAAGNQKYLGETEEGRKAKLVADERGVVLRGAITAETNCSGRFEPFRARVEFRKPLDRSGPKGFRDKGSSIEEDDRYSARYKYVVEGEREGRRDIAGTLDLEIVFRREGEEYTRCAIEGLAYGVERDKR